MQNLEVTEFAVLVPDGRHPTKLCSGLELKQVGGIESPNMASLSAVLY